MYTVTNRGKKWKFVKHVSVSTSLILTSHADEVTLVQLTKELREVSDWFSLGLHLYIPPAELYDIKHDLTLRSTQEFRTEMLSVWMKKPGASWAQVVTALMVIGRETLAHKIALKYGKTV